jgi:DNA mismatch endonuclease (patch repair protein)
LRRWAIFVHGCFWHHHPGCRRATIPKRNRSFWLDKFKANRRRDAEAIRELRQRAWDVLVIWECEVEDHPARVLASLSKLRNLQRKGDSES